MTIPIIPDIDIDFEDVVNLLLRLKSFEECSLPKLIEAERDKISNLADFCRHAGATLNDILDVNKSVDSALKSMKKLQTNLQFKLESILEHAPSTTYEANTKVNCAAGATGTDSAAEKASSRYRLEGSGTVKNTYDEFCGRPLSVLCFVHSGDLEEPTVRYSAGSNVHSINLDTSGRVCRIDSLDCNRNKIAVCGIGRIKKCLPFKPDLFGRAAFTLTVRNAFIGEPDIRMEICSDFEPRFNHDSGFVRLRGGNFKECAPD